MQLFMEIIINIHVLCKVRGVEKDQKSSLPLHALKIYDLG